MSNKTVRRGPHSKFTQAEDERLIRLVKSSGYRSWKHVAKKMMNKTSKQCRERWTNYLNPDLKFDDWTKEDDDLLLALFNKIGPKWSVITLSFENRSVNSIRNRFLKLSKQYKIPFPSPRVASKPSPEIYEIKPTPVIMQQQQPVYLQATELCQTRPLEQEPRLPFFRDYEKDMAFFDLFVDQSQSNDLYESLFYQNQI